MTDLEGRIREVLGDDARSAPPPHEPERVLGRTRRRQTLTVTGGVLGVLVVAASSVVGVRAVLTSEDGLPADAPTETTTINGVSITHPDEWFVFDPDELGLNGSTDAPPNPRVGLPRLILGVSPTDPGEMFGCPGMVEGTKPTFLMTVQEGPLALAGGSAAAWPASLEPLPIESAGNDVVESGEGGCYPGWEFLRAGWTTGGRTFEARVGFAPDVSDAEREAMLAAFKSMTFEPNQDGAASAVIATGTAGGEDWELVAAREADELVLMLQSETYGTGGGGWFESSPQELHLIDHVFGEGPERQRVVFGAVPSEAVHVNARIYPDLEVVVDVLDVPDAIDPQLNAFIVLVDPNERVTVAAYDASEELIASGEVGPGSEDPIETPLPSVVDVAPEHGGTYWAVYVWAGASLDDTQADTAVGVAEHLGFNPSVGDIACDQDAAAELGVPAEWSRVAIYFTTRADAQTAYEQLFTEHREPVGLAEVTTYCLD